ncbi:thioredoxin-like protein [Sporodiniella umbellata]|nr:thioredoxin-like protein [Sporodiniella umbellata]
MRGFILGLGAFFATIQASSIELTGSNFKAHTSSGQWFIKHYSPYCGHCKIFAPTWTELADKLDSLSTTNDFHFGEIDCTVQGDLCDEHGVLGYPELQLWKDGKKVEKYSEQRDYALLAEYIQKKTTQNSDTTQEESPVEESPVEKSPVEDSTIEEEFIEEDIPSVFNHSNQKPLPNPLGTSVDLDETKFKQTIAELDTAWFIKFYVPWCGHCQNLAPTWKQLGVELRNEVNVGEVNCEIHKSVCDGYVQGYPTILLFKDGQYAEYSGDRSLKSLMEFAKENAGPLIKPVDANGLIQYLATKEVSLIYFSKSQEIPAILGKTAEKFKDTVSFFITQDPVAIKAYGLTQSSLPRAVLVKDGQQKVFSSRLVDNEQEKLLKWLELEQFPLVARLNPSRYEAIVAGDRPAVFNVVREEDNASREKFRALAASWASLGQGSGTIFAEMDYKVWKDYVLDVFKLDASQNSKLVIYKTESSEYFLNDLQGDPLSSEFPSKVFDTLRNLNTLKGVSTLTGPVRIFSAIGRGISTVITHWFISLTLFSLIGTYWYKRSHSKPKKPYVLPSHKD